jgi:hypothetical protein
LVSVPPDQEPAWREALAAEKGFGGDAAVMGQRLGVVQDAATLTVLLGGSPLLRVPLEQLRQSYEQALPRRMDRGGHRRIIEDFSKPSPRPASVVIA